MTDHAKSPLRRFLVLAAGMTLVAGALSSGVASGQAQAAAPGLPVSVPAVAPPPPAPKAGTQVAMWAPKLNQSRVTLVKGKSFKFEEVVMYGWWNGQSVQGFAAYYAGRGVWKSSNPKVATVDSEGKVTAKKPGTATITVTAKDYTGGWQATRDGAQRDLSESATVTVVKSKPKAKVTKVTASAPKQVYLAANHEITGKYTSSKAAGVKVKYSSSKPDVLMVDRAGMLYGWSKGTAKIKVTAGGKSKTYKIKVVDLPVVMDFNPGK